MNPIEEVNSKNIGYDNRGIGIMVGGIGAVALVAAIFRSHILRKRASSCSNKRRPLPTDKVKGCE